MDMYWSLNVSSFSFGSYKIFELRALLLYNMYIGVLSSLHTHKKISDIWKLFKIYLQHLKPTQKYEVKNKSLWKLVSSMYMPLK